MIKTPISLQDLRRRIYVKAKAEPTWRFWGLYVHVCKMETLQEAYQMAKSNNGAPGIDGVTFGVIEESGVESFLKQIQDELVHNTYRPMPVRKKEIPKDGGTKVRVLSIPTIRDRVVQGALKPPGGEVPIKRKVCREVRRCYRLQCHESDAGPRDPCVRIRSMAAFRLDAWAEKQTECHT